MLKLLKNPAQIVTVDTNGKNKKAGKELSEIGIIENHSLIIEDDKIKDFIPNSSIQQSHFDEIINVSGKVLSPGIVECHTHTAFAGSRAEEFRMRLAGSSYEEIASKGGGINTTVQAVRNSSFDELVQIVKPRIKSFIEQGVTTLEIKSGYGLSYYDEIKILQVINHLNKISQIEIVPTFLGAHTYPPEYNNDHSKYLEIILDQLLPYIAENKLARFCDAFCEKTAFSAEEVDIIFKKAKSSGLKLKLHTEQFNSIGGLETGIINGAVSVDHLEVLKDEKIHMLAESDTIAVLLPGVSYFLNYDFAPARRLIESGAAVALATDYNPGSSNIINISLIMSLAALRMEMSVEEIISAFTINAAKALGMQDSIGSLEIGKQADIAVYNTGEYSDLIYQVAKNLNILTIKDGEIIYCMD